MVVKNQGDTAVTMHFQVRIIVNIFDDSWQKKCSKCRRVDIVLILIWQGIIIVYMGRQDIALLHYIHSGLSNFYE